MCDGVRVLLTKENQSESERLLSNKKSAATALDVSVRMVEYAIAAGELETRRVNSRILITADSLRRFAAADRHVPKSRPREKKLTGEVRKASLGKGANRGD